ncbi:MAG: hypothetical protein ACK5LR_02915, partial [Mangrovibacterium sp.]
IIVCVIFAKQIIKIHFRDLGFTDAHWHFPKEHLELKISFGNFTKEHLKLKIGFGNFTKERLKLKIGFGNFTMGVILKKIGQHTLNMKSLNLR